MKVSDDERTLDWCLTDGRDHWLSEAANARREADPIAWLAYRLEVAHLRSGEWRLLARLLLAELAAVRAA